MAKIVLDKMLGMAVSSSVSKASKAADSAIVAGVEKASREYVEDLKVALEKAKLKREAINEKSIQHNLEKVSAANASVAKKKDKLSKTLDTIAKNKVDSSVIPTSFIDFDTKTLDALKKALTVSGSPTILNLPGDNSTPEKRADEVIALLKTEAEHYLNMTALSSAVTSKMQFPGLSNAAANNIRGKLKYKLGTAFTQNLKEAIESKITSNVNDQVSELQNLVANAEPPESVLQDLVKDTASIKTVLSKAYKRAFTIDEKEIRERYKSFIHVLDFKKFVHDLSEDLDAILDESPEGSEENIYGGVSAVTLNKLRNETYSKELAELTTNFVNSLSTSHKDMKALTGSHFTQSSYYLNVAGEYLVVANVTAKPTDTKPKKKLNLEDYVTYSRESGKIQVNEANFNEFNLNISNRDPFEVIVAITNKFQAYLLSDAPSEGLKNILSSLKVKNALLDAGHINAVISFSAFAYSLRHYIRNSDISTLDFTKESAYFDAISKILTQDRLYTTPSSKELKVKEAFPTTKKKKGEKDPYYVDLRAFEELNSSLTNLMLHRLHNEVISANIEFFRALSSGGNLKAVVTLQAEISKVTDIFKEPEFLHLLRNLALNASKDLFVLVKPELAAANRKFGAIVQKLHKEYHTLVLTKLRDSLQHNAANISSLTGIKIAHLSGSPSIYEIIKKHIKDTLTSGKASDTTLTSSASRKTKVGQPVPKPIVSNVVININNPRSSPSKPITRPKAPASKTIPKPKTPKPIKGPTPRANLSISTSTRPKRPKVLLRNSKGQFTGVTHLRNIVNLSLFDEIKRRMRAPALMFRSGRFAQSAEVQSITQIGDTLDIKYNYMKSPYQTFEPGFKQGSPARDPQRIIGNSIRYLLRDQVLAKLKVTRV